MNIINKLAMLALVFVLSCAKQQNNNIDPSNSIKLEDQFLVLDANKTTSILAVESVNLGSVASGQVSSKTVTVTNQSGSNITLNLSALTNQFVTNTRFSMSGNTCTTTLKVNKSCSFTISLSYVASEVYNSLTAVIVSGVANPDYGKVVLSGSQNNPAPPVPSALFSVFKPSVQSLTFALNDISPQTLTQRIYLSNISTKTAIAPTINPLQYGIISNNTCSGSLKINTACYFDVTYNYTADPLLSTINEQMTFQSSDPLIDASGAAIALNVTNTQTPIKVGNLIFSQQSVISALNSATSTILYIANVGTGSATLTDLVVPNIFTIKSTTCGTLLKPNKSCSYEFIFDQTATQNMLGAARVVTVANTAGVVFAGNITSGAIADSTNCAVGFNAVNNICTTGGACSMTAHPGITDLSHIITIGGDIPNCTVWDCEPNYQISDDQKSCVPRICWSPGDLMVSNPLITNIQGIINVTGTYVTGCQFSCDTANGYIMDLTGLQCDLQKTCTAQDMAAAGYPINNYIGVSGTVVNGDVSGCVVQCDSTSTWSSSLHNCIRSCTLSDAQLNGYNLGNALSAGGSVVGNSVSACSVSTCTPGFTVNASAKRCEAQCSQADAISNGVNPSNVLSIMGLVLGTDKSACLINQCQTDYTKDAASKNCTFISRNCVISDLPQNNYATAYVSTVSGQITAPGNYSQCAINQCQSGYILSGKACIQAPVYSQTADPIVGFSNNKQLALDGTGLTFIKSGVSSNIDLTNSGLTYIPNTSTTALSVLLKNNRYIIYSTTNGGAIGFDYQTKKPFFDKMLSQANNIFPDSLGDDYCILSYTGPIPLFNTPSTDTQNVVVRYQISTKTIVSKVQMPNISNLRMTKASINNSNNLIEAFDPTTSSEKIYDFDTGTLYSTTIQNAPSSVSFYPFFYNSSLFLFAVDSSALTLTVYKIGANSLTTQVGQVAINYISTDKDYFVNNGVIYARMDSVIHSINLTSGVTSTRTIPQNSTDMSANGNIFAYDSLHIYKYNYSTQFFDTIKTFSSGNTILSMTYDQSNTIAIARNNNAGGSTITWLDATTLTFSESGLVLPTTSLSFQSVKPNLFLYRKIALVSTPSVRYTSVGFLVNKNTGTFNYYDVNNSSGQNALGSMEYIIDDSTAFGLWSNQSNGSQQKMYIVNITGNTYSLLYDLTPNVAQTIVTDISDFAYTSLGGIMQIPFGNQLVGFSDQNGSGIVAQNAVTATSLSKMFVFQNNVFFSGIIPDTNGNTIDRELLKYNAGNAIGIFLDLFNMDNNYRRYKFGFDLNNSDILIEPDRFFFNGHATASGFEPWVYMNSVATRLCDINTSSETIFTDNSSSPHGFIRIGTKIYFIASTATEATQIFAYDEATTSCSKLTSTANIPSGTYAYPGSKLGSILLLSCNDSASGFEPCFFNTTTNVLSRLSLATGTASSISSKTPYRIFNGKAYFYGINQPASKIYLYETDGTIGGTVIKDTLNFDMAASVSLLDLAAFSAIANKKSFYYATTDSLYYIKNKTISYIDLQGVTNTINNPNNYIVSYIIGETTENLYVLINNHFIGFINKLDATKTLHVIQDQNGDPILDGYPMNLTGY